MDRLAHHAASQNAATCETINEYNFPQCEVLLPWVFANFSIQRIVCTVAVSICVQPSRNRCAYTSRVWL